MAKRLILAGALALVACKQKQDAPREAPAPTPASAPVAIAVDAAVASPAIDAAPVPLPSETLVADGLGPVLRAGPARTPDHKELVWCTRGSSGMADWVETVCHQAGPGRKTTAIPVMTYADAMAIDDGADPAASDAAGLRGVDARERVAQAVARLGAVGGAGLVAMPAPVRCTFAGGELTSRDDAAAADDPGSCVIGGLTVEVNPQGKVSLVRADQVVFTEVFKPRPRGDCALEVGAVEVTVDAGAQLAAVAVALGTASEACTVVTEYEVRALRLP